MDSQDRARRDWQGRRVLLTGAAGGIGRCLAKQLAASGACVALVDRDVAGLQAVRDELRAAGSEALVVPADLSDGAQTRQVVETVLDAWGRVDVLINNAGLLAFTPLEEEAPADTERLFKVNLLAPVLLSRALLPHFKEHGAGQIVNVGSIFGSIGFAWFATYSASKFAIRGFSEALRRELAGTGIDVTYVAPRATRTALAKTFGRMAEAVKMKLDEPELVARRIQAAAAKRQRDRYLGFPECVFVRLNALLPRVVDKALAKQDALAAPFALEAAASASSGTPASSGETPNCSSQPAPEREASACNS